MDPEACLQRALRALERGELDEARDALDDYRGWRARGGFMPERGDERASALAHAWRDARFPRGAR